MLLLGVTGRSSSAGGSSGRGNSDRLEILPPLHACTARCCLVSIVGSELSSRVLYGLSYRRCGERSLWEADFSCVGVGIVEWGGDW